MTNAVLYSQVHQEGEYRVTFIEHRALFGLIKWYEKVCEDHVGNDIFIETERQIRNVYLNGKKLK